MTNPKEEALKILTNEIISVFGDKLDSMIKCGLKGDDKRNMEEALDTVRILNKKYREITLGE